MNRNLVKKQFFHIDYDGVMYFCEAFRATEQKFRGFGMCVALYLTGYQFGCAEARKIQNLVQKC